MGFGHMSQVNKRKIQRDWARLDATRHLEYAVENVFPINRKVIEIFH